MSKIKLVLALLLTHAAFGQGISGGGGGGGAPSGPAGGDLCSTSTYPNPTVCSATGNTGIADPVSALVGSLVGTPGMTTYSWVVVKYNGIGNTLASPAKTITNGPSVLDAMNFENLTLPIDAGVTCLIVRSAGTGAMISTFGLPCDGSVIPDDNTSGYFVINVIGLPVQNTTAGISLAGVGIQNSNTAQQFPLNSNFSFAARGGIGTDIGVVDAFGNDSGTYFGVLDSGGFWTSCIGDSSGHFCDGTQGAQGFWQNVSTATTGSSYQAKFQLDGFIKCDPAGDSTIILPPVANFPRSSMQNLSYGRWFTVHKPASAHTCTIQTSDGTTINGLSTYVLTAGQHSVTVYWDADGDGNTPLWATSSQEPFAGSGTLGGNVLVAGACDTPITVTIAGAAAGMVVVATPQGSPGAGTFTQQWISGANTVTAQVCDSVAGTPASLTYDFRVIQ